MPTSVSRRTFVASLAGTAGAAWIVAHTGELRAALDYAAQLPHTNLQTFKVLTLQDAADLEAAMALIVPTDSTPGAREARVIHFLDRSLETFARNDRAIFETIATQLRASARKKGKATFTGLSSDVRLEVLTGYQRDEPANFEQLRAITIVGMFADPSYGGNQNGSGWKLIGFDDQFSWVAPFGWYDQQGR